ncbi:MAG: aminotransferase class I/II-fold pyridoxal phosphate-dependent enzyme [Pseudobacteriovorax sp.]|nr:aminotransferase class I/II-fold pyridoxal phosphate-dependent enzyme [Pseudobacteriovorax sp.]
MSQASNNKSFEGFDAYMKEALTQAQGEGNLRSLIYDNLDSPTEFDIDLSHNDYLNLRSFQPLKDAVFKELQDLHLPFGSGGSRLLGGDQKILRQLEQEFVKWLGCYEDALYFPSGYAANEAIGQAIFTNDTEVFSDQLNHASIIDGLRLSHWTRDQKKIFRHNDLNQLSELLAASEATIKCIITESIFSMDGDSPRLPELLELCQIHNAMLILDEAHAIGVYGKNGSGLASELTNIENAPIIGIYPCGKALATQGAFVAGTITLRKYLINRARSFIYTTAPSPWMALALKNVIKLMPDLEERRVHLSKITNFMRSEFKRLGVACLDGDSHIVPVIVGDQTKGEQIVEKAREKGIACRLIRPPTVAPDSCRIRISLHAELNFESCHRIIEVFKP